MINPLLAIETGRVSAFLQIMAKDFNIFDKLRLLSLPKMPLPLYPIRILQPKRICLRHALVRLRQKEL